MSVTTARFPTAAHIANTKELIHAAPISSARLFVTPAVPHWDIVAVFKDSYSAFSEVKFPAEIIVNIRSFQYRWVRRFFETFWINSPEK